MCRGMRKLCIFKVRCYVVCIIDINHYLDVFPWEKARDKFCEMELNEILLSSMPNSWSRQEYVQGV